MRLRITRGESQSAAGSLGSLNGDRLFHSRYDGNIPNKYLIRVVGEQRSLWRICNFPRKLQEDAGTRGDLCVEDYLGEWREKGTAPGTFPSPGIDQRMRRRDIANGGECYCLMESVIFHNDAWIYLYNR